MEGAVRIGGATSGSSAPPGWSLSYASGEGTAPALGAWVISDGTITFTLSKSVLPGKTPSLVYDGSDATFKAVLTGDTVVAFTQAVVNNSADDGGVPPGSSPRNLAITLLGTEAATAEDVTEIVNRISQTVRNGKIDNIVLGDYFGLPFLIIDSGYDSGGAFVEFSNTEIVRHGHWLDLVVVSKNGLKNINGNISDHVILQSRNVFSDMTSVLAGGHYMELSDTHGNGYLGCKMRQFLINNVLTGLQNAGIPFSTDKIPVLSRRVANISLAAVDTIEDKIWLPAEWEIFGAAISGGLYENSDNQGRLEYYQSASNRIKYANIKGSATAVRWWLASTVGPNSANNNFRIVYNNGNSDSSAASYALGVAPAFPIS
jgi:hypothetical protein